MNIRTPEEQVNDGSRAAQAILTSFLHHLDDDAYDLIDSLSKAETLGAFAAMSGLVCALLWSLADEDDNKAIELLQEMILTIERGTGT